jgi:ribosomal protein RSM22 (predicted rRNA methylase)
MLIKALSKKTTSTIYATPPIPPANKPTSREKHLKLAERAELSYNQHLASRVSDLKQVDFILYRSFPNLFYISRRMFSELCTFDKDFAPLNMLDLGNNLGATVWAVQKYYGDTIDDYVIHEHSKEEYNRTIKLLNVKYKPHIDNVTVKGCFSMPRASDNQFDMVTAVNYFPHFQENEFRKWFDKVWKCTGQYLIIADISNRYTSMRMSNIRSYFNKRYKKEGHILAPCPHAHNCPMRKKNDSQVCRFTMNNVTTISPKKLLADGKVLLNHQENDYTYLILKRGPKAAATQFARLLGPIKHHNKKNQGGKKVLEFQTCNSDGTLWRATASPSQSPSLYKHVVNRKSGDLLDQRWWDHHFASSAVYWTSKSIEDQVVHRAVRNKTKFSYQVDKTVKEAGDQEYLAQVDPGSGQNVEGSWSLPADFPQYDEEFMLPEDHLESISLLSENDI